MSIILRPQKIEDAARFCEILNHPDFIYFPAKPQTVEEEEDYLRQAAIQKQQGLLSNYSIVYGNMIVGTIGIKIDQHRKYIGELGYFIAREHWGKGFATQAVKLVEKIGFEEYRLKRIEIVIHPQNIGSEQVAIKAGYQKEGLLRKYAIAKIGGALQDICLYAKVL